jgi:hypothetical protein
MGQQKSNTHYTILIKKASLYKIYGSSFLKEQLQSSLDIIEIRLFMPIVLFISVSWIRIRIRIRRIHMFLGLLDPDPDPQVRVMDPNPALFCLFQCRGFGSESGSVGSICFWGLLDPDPDPQVRIMDPNPALDPSISKQNSKKNLDSYCFVTFIGLFIFEK